MYSLEKKKIAIELLIKNEFQYVKTMTELEYPESEYTLRRWYKEYQTKEKKERKRYYSKEERIAAVTYYLENGCNFKKTIRELGYPSTTGLRKWLLEEQPEAYHPCQKKPDNIHLSQAQKEQAAIELYSNSGNSKEIAEKYGTTVYSVYYWRKFLPKEIPKSMTKRRPDPKTQEEAEAMIAELKAEVAQLTEQTEDLKKQVYRLNLERSVLEKAAEILKKDQGISIQFLTNREKAIAINALREQFPLKDLLQILQIAKSSYFYQVIAMQTDRQCEMRKTVRTVFEESKGRYGYRRVHAVIKNSGQRVSEKVVRRLMHEQGLCVRNVKKRKYSSYLGEISPPVENVINRDFHAEKPNEKWLTDITEFHIPAGKVYLSPIIDCFDGLPVSWTIGTSPSAELANTMLDEAIVTLEADEKPIVHSDYAEENAIPKICSAA